MTKKSDNGINPPDMDLWKRVADTVDAYAPSPASEGGMSELLDEADAPVTAPKDKETTVKAAPTPIKIQNETAKAPQSREVDGNTARRLKRGKIPIDKTIDLHGLNQDRAHSLFAAAVSKAYGSEQRCLLVITGKGLRSKEPGGVLKKKLPEWCDLPPIAHIILKVVPAQPIHGGGGAFYVYLRSKRSK